jgi:DNA polymerase III epsilon subunit-like protein
VGTDTETDSLPVYKAREVPDHLRTMTQLKTQRLKPAEGQQPVAFLRMYRSGHGWGEFPLYDPAGAAPMRPLSAKQQAAVTARRTCPKCGEVRDYVVYQACGECQQQELREEQELRSRTCWGCQRVSTAPHPAAQPGQPQQERRGECVPCWLRRVIRLQLEAERAVVWRRTCPARDCTEVTATNEEIAIERAAGTWAGPRWCPPCKARDEQERAERAREAREAEWRAIKARRKRVAELVDWARALLADPDTVVLDTETTGLEDDARVLEVAVYSMAGQVLLDTLVDPGEPIPPEVSDLHGITDQLVAGAPTFSEIMPLLATVLDGRRCLIYNKSFDVGRLKHELTVHHRQAGHADPVAAARAWLETVRFEDVMLPFSEWVGDWDDYFEGYAWQPLIGGEHRALGDCRAVVELLRGMVMQGGEA